MNKYKAFYEGKELDITAATSYMAQQRAVDKFNPPKSKRHMVHVHLCEKDGEQVTHVATE